MANKKDYVIPEFEKLEDCEQPGECVSFMEWIGTLNQAYNAILQEQNVERASLFPEALLEAVKRLSPYQTSQRPRNVIPLSVHEPGLQHYTDKERPNAIAKLKKMKIYKHLEKLL